MIRLSYVITTFNKLPYLTVTLPLLIEACKADEEIIVIDGGSEDGTKNYLEKLYAEKKIHQFISEKDFGEAHGTNKGFLLANGILIKIITDDDVFNFNLIQDAKEFMLTNKHIDVLGFDGWGCNIDERFKFEKTNYIDGFKKWKETQMPFLFCGLSLLIRKTSLSHLGLLSIRFKIIDMEYSLRISSQQAKIAFCTEPGFVNIITPNSNSQKFYKTIRKEQRLLKKIYPSISENFKINKPIVILKDKLKRLKTPTSKSLMGTSLNTVIYQEVVNESILKLKSNYHSSQNQFLM